MNKTSTLIKYYIMLGQVNFETHYFKIALMNNNFIFSPYFENWNSVSAYELDSGNGYVAGGQLMSFNGIHPDTVNNKCKVEFVDVQWTASGGPIGPSNGAIIYDTSSNDVIVGFIKFSPPKTQASGGIFTISNIALELS